MNQIFGSNQYMMEKHLPIYIMRCTHDHHNRPEMHGHDFIELVYIVSGYAQHCFEGEFYDIQSGDVFIINPGEVHTYLIDEGQQIEIINCLFYPELIQDTLLRELGISQSMDYFYVHPFLDKAERFHHRLNLSGRDASRILTILDAMITELTNRQAGYAPLIRIQMIEMLIMLSRFYSLQHMVQNRKISRSNEHQMLVRRVNGFLERHYDKRITIPMLGELFNTSTRQMNRVFKSETGQTILERTHHIRIEKAKQYLLETDEKVIQVANRVGYDDPAFFSQLFHRQVGCPPGKFRDQYASPQ